jgi:hypothetical protein
VARALHGGDDVGDQLLHGGRVSVAIIEMDRMGIGSAPGRLMRRIPSDR